MHIINYIITNIHIMHLIGTHKLFQNYILIDIIYI